MSKYHNVFQGFVKAFTGAAKRGEKGSPTTIIGVKPKIGKLKKIQDSKKKITDVVDTYASGADDKLKKEFRKTTKKSLDRISKIYNKGNK